MTASSGGSHHGPPSLRSIVYEALYASTHLGVASAGCAQSSGTVTAARAPSHPPSPPAAPRAPASNAWALGGTAIPPAARSLMAAMPAGGGAAAAPAAAGRTAAACGPALALEVAGLPQAGDDLASLLDHLRTVGRVITAFAQSDSGGGSALLLLPPGTLQTTAAQLVAGGLLQGCRLDGSSLQVSLCSDPASWVQSAVGIQVRGCWGPQSPTASRVLRGTPPPCWPLLPPRCVGLSPAADFAISACSWQGTH